MEGEFTGSPVSTPSRHSHNPATVTFLAIQNSGCPSTIVISCMAGISASTLQNLWNIPVHRMIPSGPETILARKSITELYP